MSALRKSSAANVEIFFMIASITRQYHDKCLAFAWVRKFVNYLLGQGRSQIGLRGHCEHTPRLNLSSGPVAALGQGQKPQSTSRNARGGGGLGTVTWATRLIAWLIVGLIVLGIVLYLYGPAAPMNDELVVIGLLIIGLVWFEVWLRRRGQ
jgi:hypothetical protein